MFIIIALRLGSDKLVCCVLFCLSQEISHGMRLIILWRVDDFFIFDRSSLFC